MRVGYGRVSTLDQSPQMQVDALRAAGCERIFAETASGVQRDRPQLTAALDFMRQGDTLVVWKLDRLARSTRQLIDTADALKARGIGLQSLTETIDTTTPGGELVFTLFAALAQFERALIVERTREGLKAAALAGRKPGRRPKMTPELARDITSRLRDPLGYPTVSDVIRASGLGRATFYKHFPPDQIATLRPRATP